MKARVTLIAALAACAGIAAAKPDLYPQLGAFARVLTLIEQSYIERIPAESLIERAIGGMVRSLDRHSEFVPRATYRTLRGDTPASIAHVGIDLQLRGKDLVIGGLLPDAPASRSGLRLGDAVSQIDGARPASLEKAAAALSGSPGSKVIVTIERSGFVVPRRFTLVREPLPDIGVSVVRRDARLVATVRRFSDRMSRMLEDTLRYELERAPAEGVILDLRGNGGGLIEEAVRLLDLFLDDGDVLIVVGREGKVVERFSATPQKRSFNLPLAVLIDSHSASAAEIVAGALQDRKRARVLGETSYGKGSVQTIVELDDGSAVRFTTALYFTPSMRKVEGHGIAPDVVLAPGEDWLARAAAEAK